MLDVDGANASLEDSASENEGVTPMEGEENEDFLISLRAIYRVKKKKGCEYFCSADQCSHNCLW